MSDPVSNYDYLIKFLALGDSSVGKTCFINYYVDNEYRTDYGNTVGVDFKQKLFHYKSDGKNTLAEKEAKLNLQIWDTAGQERFRSLTTSFFRDAMGFILMFSVTDEQSFLHLRDWVRLLRQNAYCESPDMILVGNKADLDSKREVSRDAVQKFADELGIEYIETSAQNGTNVNEVFESLVPLIMKRIRDTVDSSILPIAKSRDGLRNQVKGKSSSNKENKKEEKKGCAC